MSMGKDDEANEGTDSESFAEREREKLTRVSLFR